MKIDNSMFEKKKKKPVRRSEKQTDNEEHICDLKDRIMGENESNIQDLWDSLKCSNLCIIGIPEGDERENGIKNRSEEIMAENVSNLKEKDIQIQEIQTVPHKMIPNKTIVQEVIIEMTQNLKIMREF